jgi:adenylate cyclase
MSCTVHGDAVNLAARLEQLNKRFGSYVLADEETVKRLSFPARMEPVDDVQIRGRAKSVRVFRCTEGVI